MVRTCVGVALLACIVSLLAGAAAAQVPPGTVYLMAKFSGANEILCFDASGVPTTVITLSGTPGADSIGMAPTNDAILVWDSTVLRHYDVSTATETTTTLKFAAAGGLLNWGCLDEDGGMIWVENGSTTTGLNRADDLQGKNSTLIWSNSVNTATANACCWDGSTGGYVVGQTTGTGNLSFVARDGTTTRTVTTGAGTVSGLDWSPWTSDIIVSYFGGLLRVNALGTVTTVATGSAVIASANGVEVLDQNLLNAEQFLVCDYGGSPHYLSLVSGAGVIITLNSATNNAPCDCEKYQGRQLWGHGTWNVGGLGVMHLTMGAGFSGDAYQLALSYTGHGPGIKLGGFTLHLTPDNLFYLTASNVAPGTFRNFAGVLGTNGRPATAPSLLIPRIAALRGVRLWAGALAYNSKGRITGVSNCWGITLQ